MVISSWYYRLFSDLSHTKNHTKNAKNVVIARDLSDFTHIFCNMVKNNNFRILKNSINPYCK